MLDFNGVSANAQAPRNGTLRHEDTLPFADRQCHKAARVPLSGGRMSAEAHSPLHTIGHH
jgi:hypothetical protein